MSKIAKHSGKKRRNCAGFYISAAAAALGLVGGIVFNTGFSIPAYAEYYSVTPLICAIIGAVAYAAMSVTAFTANLAPKVLFITTLVEFLSFVSCSYMYLSGVFYSGVSLETIQMIDPVYLTSAVTMLLAFVLANVAFWCKQVESEENAA